jgi:hypothetical protein
MPDTFRFHVLGLAHTETTSDYLHCAYTQKVIKFVEMMHSLGHHVVLYGGEDNEAPCDEFVTCIHKAEMPDYEVGMASFIVEAPHWVTMNQRAVEAIRERIQPRDFICVIGGLCQKPVTDAFPHHMAVEWGIGYEGVYAPYQVYESHAWRHHIYGMRSGGRSGDGRDYDAVIPNAIDPDDFDFTTEHDDYHLYLGRLIERKGVGIAMDACQRLGVPLVLAGAMEPGFDVRYGMYVGLVGARIRRTLLARAAALWVPTRYIEPWGGVHVEAMVSGTPVITSDFGVFPETVLHGVVGYRCRTFGEYVWAASNLGNLDPKVIHEYATGRYATNVVRWQYQDYFERLSTLWDDGWYTVDPEADKRHMLGRYAI